MVLSQIAGREGDWPLQCSETFALVHETWVCLPLKQKWKDTDSYFPTLLHSRKSPLFTVTWTVSRTLLSGTFRPSLCCCIAKCWIVSGFWVQGRVPASGTSAKSMDLTCFTGAPEASLKVLIEFHEKPWAFTIFSCDDSLDGHDQIWMICVNFTEISIANVGRKKWSWKFCSSPVHRSGLFYFYTTPLTADKVIQIKLSHLILKLDIFFYFKLVNTFAPNRIFSLMG